MIIAVVGLPLIILFAMVYRETHRLDDTNIKYGYNIQTRMNSFSTFGSSLVRSGGVSFNPLRNQTSGLMYYFHTSGIPYIIFYGVGVGGVFFGGPIVALNNKITFTITRSGRDLSCKMLYNSVLSTMTTSAPTSDFTYSNGILTASTLDKNIDLGTFPLRLGGYANGSIGNDYAITNHTTENFTGILNNFVCNITI